MLHDHPAISFLIDACASHEEASWLVPGGPAAVVQELSAAFPGADIHWQPVDVRELGEGEDLAVSVSAPGSPVPAVDGAAILSPPDRDLARRWLLETRAALAPGGRLCLAGANAEGIRSVISDAARLFGTPQRKGYGQKQRFAVFVAGESPDPMPAWASKPGIAPGTWEPFAVETGNGPVDLVTQAGVFAGAKIDAGTRLLLDALPVRIEGRVLDIGCGAGVIGIVAAHRGATAVDMTDANLLAVQAAAENIRRQSLDTCRAFASDVFDAVGDTRYDLIVSNPPFHQGKTVDYSVPDRLIAEAPVHLTEGGSLLIVANAFLAYGKRMERVFERVETVVATKQYHVLRAFSPR
jgi:16S rRNA (guanine1207-N2)-methyltransferase